MTCNKYTDRWQTTHDYSLGTVHIKKSHIIIHAGTHTIRLNIRHSHKTVNTPTFWNFQALLHKKCSVNCFFFLFSYNCFQSIAYILQLQFSMEHNILTSFRFEFHACSSSIVIQKLCSTLSNTALVKRSQMTFRYSLFWLRSCHQCLILVRQLGSIYIFSPLLMFPWIVVSHQKLH